MLLGFSGLLRGSVRGRSRKVKSQICDDVIRRPSSGNRRSLNSVLPNIPPSMSDKGEMEKGMETLESMRSGSARVDMWPASEEHSFDDSEEWAKVRCQLKIDFESSWIYYTILKSYNSSFIYMNMYLVFYAYLLICVYIYIYIYIYI